MDRKTQNPEQKTPNSRQLSEEETRIDSILSSAIFEDFEGNEVTLSDFKGKVVLVDFWETWCSPCLAVFPAMDSLKTEYKEDFEVVAVNLLSIDTKEEVEQFIAEKPI